MDINDIEKIQLTTSQEFVLKQLLSFINHPTDRVFILKGYAGTGKTTLMRFLIRQLESLGKNYQLLASTGRAAKILSNLSGNASASTIHSMVYDFNGLNKELNEKEELKADQYGQLFLVFEPTRLAPTDVSETIYIIDEASMVSDVVVKNVTQAKFGDGRLLQDLLQYDTRKGSKYIFVGDPCQLPPIEQYFSPALMKEYVQNTFGVVAQEAQLTKIMRQKGSNGIIDASKRIRILYAKAPDSNRQYGLQVVWGMLPFRNNKNIALHANVEEMLNHYVSKVQKDGLNSAVCICRSNASCADLSARIREKLGFARGCLQKGDLLMVTQNNMLTGLMNGDVVVVEEISKSSVTRAHLTFRQVKVRELFTGNSYSSLMIEEIVNQSKPNLDKQQQHALFLDFIYRMLDKGITAKNNRQAFYDMMFHDSYLNALRCVFGYAITCHKSQGGEWEDVYVHVPRNITKNPTKETYQWIYTSMTRAQKTLHMVDDFYIR